MRVVLADDITDDTGRLLVGLVPVVRQLVHGEKDAPMHRLETVAGVRQSPPDNDAHCIIEIRAPHLVFEADGQGFLGESFHLLPADDATEGVMSAS